MKNKTFKSLIAPSLTLVFICIAITIALVAANAATKPQIEKIAKENADKTRAEVLKKADSFTAYDGELNDGITEVYMADNKVGAVVTSTSKSFGGTMTVMVGIDKEGSITGVQVTNHADTPGLGTKAMTPEYLKGYKGITSLTGDKIKNDKDVDYIVGASVSSDGVYDAVKSALQQFRDCGGVQ